MPCEFSARRPEPFLDMESNCQFDIPEGELIDVDGRLWCEFHAPITKENGDITNKGMWGNDICVDFETKIARSINESRNNNQVCDMTGVIFPKGLEFPPMEFPSMCFFRAEFNGNVSFVGAKFIQGEVSFEEAKFNIGMAWFSSAEFSGGDASFINAEFNKCSASFYATKFNGGSAWFDGVKFIDSGAIFENAEFTGGHASFSEAHFDAAAEFSTLSSLKDSNPQSPNAFQFCDFTNVEFKGVVNFQNRQFLNSTSFRDCIFSRAPWFHNCVLHQDTDFVGAQFEDRNSETAARAYRTLKLAMENLRSRDEEANFHALELESLYNRDDTPKSVKYASYIYEKLSDYGRDFILPLGWLATLFGVFLLIYMTLIRATAIQPVVPEGILKFSLGFTLDQLVLPFRGGLEKLPKAVEHIWDYRLLYRFIGAVQSIGSISLIALFLLALRRRFKMD